MIGMMKNRNRIISSGIIDDINILIN